MQRPSPYVGKIKIFSDGADRASIIEMAANPIIKGITTNPSLMKKAGAKDYRAYCKEIISLTSKQLSFEVLADDFKEMKRQALEIASWGDNVYVKIPIINSKGESAGALINELSHANVKLNVTAITTFNQVLDACQNLKGGAPSYISVFAGRLADTGRDPLPLMQASLEVCLATDKNIELLWASTREVYNIVQAEQLGCHIITAPPEVIKKLSGFNKEPFQLSVETVQTFCKDIASAGLSL
jgi:transaldolase